jgi:hypothetical protein
MSEIFKYPKTQRQAEVLKYVKDFMASNGYTPSYRTICKAIGVASKATVAKHISALRRQGFIEEDFTISTVEPQSVIRLVKQPPLVCRVEGCESQARIRQLCFRHYRKEHRYGDPLGESKPRYQPRALPDITSPTELGKVLGVSRQRAEQLLKPQARRAREAVNQAIKARKLVRPTQCERCGATNVPIEAHHWDYREMLDVRWICRACHGILHTKASR